MQIHNQPNKVLNFMFIISITQIYKNWATNIQTDNSGKLV